MRNITVETVVNGTLEKVWEFWTTPIHIEKWNNASSDWECPHAENDIHVGGKFLFTMAAKDGSVSFDFNGTYTEVTPLTSIAYTIEGGRKVSVMFAQTDIGVRVTEIFEMEDINSEEMQKGGWQSILNNFKQYVEHN